VDINPNCVLDINIFSYIGGYAMKWEYKVIQIEDAVKAGFGKLTGGALKYKTESINAEINSAGNDGWELIEVIAPVGTAGTANHLLFFFKRQKV
jgi:hypothetical protein